MIFLAEAIYSMLQICMQRIAYFPPELASNQGEDTKIID